jgi:hypothetical protein
MPHISGDITPTASTDSPPLPRIVTLKLPPLDPPKRQRLALSRWDRNDPHLIALYAFLTGIVLAGSLALAIRFHSTPQGWLFLTFLAFFHFMEYYITAKYRPDTVTIDGTHLGSLVDLAFLFNNGVPYLLAQIGAMMEFLIELSFAPHTKVLSQTTVIGSHLTVPLT